jgi:uncharacterized protein involved in exopolysaccharide biosynthesis
MTHDRPMEDVRNTIGEYARLVRNRWRPALVGLALVASTAFWCSQWLPRRFAASTIFERRDDVVLRNLISKNSPYSFESLKSTLVMDMTGSRAMANAAVTLGILAPEAVPAEGPLTEAGLRALDEALAAHGLRASVQMLQSTPSLDTIKLTCEAHDPDMAQRCVVALRDGYISHTRDRITDVLRSTRRFFQTEVDRLQQQLSSTNQALAEPFKDFPGLDPNDTAGAGHRLEVLRSERERLLERKTELEAQVAVHEQYAALIADQPAGAGATEAFQRSVRAAMAKIDQEMGEAMALRRMTAEHPEVRGLQAKRAALSALLDELVRQSSAEALAHAGDGWAVSAPDGERNAQQLRAKLELEALQRQLAAVQAKFEHADERVRRFGALFERLLKHGAGLRDLTDQAATQADTLATWREHLLQLDRIMAADSEQRGTSFAVLEEAKNSDRPVSPRGKAVMAVCTASGLAGAALLIGILELLDRSFRSAGQVARALGIPVLESIGVIPTPQVRRKRWLCRLLWAPTLTLLLAVLLTTGALAYFSLEHPRAYDSALTNLRDAVPRYLGLGGNCGTSVRP